MLASVFLMQPLGQLFAYLVSLWVTIGHVPSKGDPQYIATKVDQAWRWVVGVGAIPALIAIVFRLTIPESPRYTLDVQRRPERALADARTYLRVNSVASGAGADLEYGRQLSPMGPGQPGPMNHANANDSVDSVDATPPTQHAATPSPLGHATRDQPAQFSYEDMKDYFWTQGHWRYLAATSICWALLDFVFYGS